MISFIVPSIGRLSLQTTLDSIRTMPGDEILVIGSMGVASDPRVCYIPCAPGNDWGCTERTIGIHLASQPYLAFLDDDDVYTPWAREAMARAIAVHADKPALFRMQYPNGFVLWHEPRLRCGNVSTQMILIPNDKGRLGTWTTRREGDYDFLASMQWDESEIYWNPEIVAFLGHNDAC